MSSWMKPNQVVDLPLPSSLLDPPAQRERQACKVSFVFSAENHFFYGIVTNLNSYELVFIGDLYAIVHCSPGDTLPEEKDKIMETCNCRCDSRNLLHSGNSVGYICAN